MTVPRPNEVLRIRLLGRAAKRLNQSADSVALVGGGEVRWKQEADALTLDGPSAMPFRHAVSFRVKMRGTSVSAP